MADRNVTWDRFAPPTAAEEWVSYLYCAGCRGEIVEGDECVEIGGKLYCADCAAETFGDLPLEKKAQALDAKYFPTLEDYLERTRTLVDERI